MASKLLLASFIGLAIAQSTTLTIPVIHGDGHSVAASVVSVKAGTTALSIACIRANCDLFPQDTIMIGPSSWHEDKSDPFYDATATVDCAFGSASAVCTLSQGGSGIKYPGVTTTTVEAGGVGSVFIVVTAGAEKLTASAKATPTGVKSSVAASATASASATAKASATATSNGTATATASEGSGTVTPSKAGSAAPGTFTGAAAANAVVLGGGFVGAAVGLLGGIML